MTSKPSKILKCHKASSKLYQSSLRDFMKLKPSQKENFALSKTSRRRIQRRDDGMEKMNKKREDVSQGRKGWQTKVPFERSMFRTPPQYVLVPDAPSRRGTPDIDDDHFAIRSSLVNGFPRFGDIEVVPSSQSQDTEELSTRYSDKDITLHSTQTRDIHLPSPPRRTNSLPRVETELDLSVQSSQSQYLLSYEQSPALPASRGGRSRNPVEVVQTSQVAEESELEQSSPYYGEFPKTGIIDPQYFAYLPELTSDKDLVRVESLSNADEADIPVASPPGQIVVIPQTQPGLPFRLLPSLAHSPFPPGERLAPIVISTSPHVASSQYNFPSEGASYPPEVRSFFRMLEEDRHSLGSEFHGLSQSLASEESHAH